MFTGLVEETGRIVASTPTPGGRRLIVSAQLVLEDAAVDHSIAVNGVCLTVVALDASTFSADVIPETLSKTTIGELAEGSIVNLERALRLGDRLGGHLVQGHVDTTGTIDSIIDDGNVWEMWVAFAPEYRRLLIPMGSITIDGISLTVADLEADRLKVAIIPHTLAVTNLRHAQPGRHVNLEFDMMAKYAVRDAFGV
ncbi:MAG: riboflavin synthase [Candidatus Kapabacteria bacterium]|nr:riboflavin synthase [Candidatus Kapabacteria bacterium]